MSDLRSASGAIWRIVEAQHRYSTTKLVDDPDEQIRLEELLDPTKPPVPEACRHLDFLLFTPFRYHARGDSRFRRAGPTPPAFYAAEHEATAMAEIAFWRLLFFQESPATPWPANPAELTAFRVRFETAALIDLTRPPFDADEAKWTDPVDYTATHRLADRAHEEGAEAIRSTSARDPDRRANITLLSCAAFAEPAPHRKHSWRLKLSATGQFAIREAPYAALTFARDAFARDPRIAEMAWKR